MQKRDHETAFAMMETARAHKAMATSVEMNMREQFAEEVAPVDKGMCEDDWENPHVDYSTDWTLETPSYYDMDIPVRGIMYHFGVNEEAVLYTPAVSAYDCSAPVHDPSAVQYQRPRRPPPILADLSRLRADLSCLLAVLSRVRADRSRLLAVLSRVRADRSRLLPDLSDLSELCTPDIPPHLCMMTA